MRGHSGDNRRMTSLTLDCVETESELLSAELWEHGASGIQEHELPGGRVRLQAWFDANDGLAERFAAYGPRVEDEKEVDWETLSRQAWQPVEVGARFYLAPEWDESPTPEGRMRLTVHPGMALGTGDHPATQLVLVAMEKHLGKVNALSTQAPAPASCSKARICSARAAWAATLSGKARAPRAVTCWLTPARRASSPVRCAPWPPDPPMSWSPILTP